MNDYMEEIDRLALKFGSLERGDRHTATDSQRQNLLKKIDARASELVKLIGSLDVQARDELVTGHAEAGGSDMMLPESALYVLRDLAQAAFLAAEAIEPEAKRPQRRWKHELAFQVLDVLKAAGVEIKIHGKSEAAAVLRGAFKQAGMSAGDVRKYLSEYVGA